MPKLTNSVPKYRKHRASKQAVVELAGKTYYLGPWGSKASRVEYDRLVGEWLAGGRSGSFGSAPSELTISELLVSYLAYAKRRYVKAGRPTSEQQLIKWALKPVRELYGKTTAADFGPLALKAVRRRFVEADFSRKTINDSLRRIRRMFRWGVAEQLVPAAVLQALEAVEGLRAGEDGVKGCESIQPVAESDVQAVLPHLPLVVSDMVRFQRLTGARPAEVCMVRPCDVDATGDVWRFTPREHKTEHHGKDRVIFIGPRAQAILRPYLLRAADAYCFSPKESERKRRAEASARRVTSILQGNAPGSNCVRHPQRTAGKRYTTDSYRRAIHRACVKARVARWSPNRLRHSAATEIRSRFGLEAAQVTLGHSRADVTQVYAERDYALAAKVAREVG